MKRRQVSRAGVFETNSSSTHSISIAGGTYTPDTILLDDGICKIHTGEFGWDEDTFTSASMKASYCLTFTKTCSGKQHDAHLAMLKLVLEDATDAEVEFVKSSDEYSKWGYIDHQSDAVCGEAFESIDALRSFIFNPKSCLETDNDNH